MRIWFIGLGLMGIPMAKNIISKWGDFTVWNRTPEKASELVSLGAKLAPSKQELAKNVDILITMVTAWEDVDDVIFGSDGVIDSLTPGSIVIDMSTIGVEWAESIGKRLSDRWIFFLDAPVTGSTPKAITGELTIFVWWEKEVFETAKPVLAMMGTNLQYMGKIGNGQAMKLINNTLVAYLMIGLSDVMKLAPKMGLSLDRTAEVIKTLPVSSPYTAMKIDNFVRDEYPMMFSLANMAKDIALAHGEMEKYGLSLDMLILAYEKYQKWLLSSLGGLDVSAIGKVEK
jgi:3-hydroxyisobutyrate dehydrogenase